MQDKSSRASRIISVLILAMQVAILWRVELNRSEYTKCQEHASELYAVLTWYLDVMR